MLYGLTQNLPTELRLKIEEMKMFYGLILW